MRNYFCKLQQDGAQLLEAAAMLNEQSGLKSAADFNPSSTPINKNGVGEIVERGEFGLGVAPRDSRPVHKIELTKEQEAALNDA